MNDMAMFILIVAIAALVISILLGAVILPLKHDLAYINLEFSRSASEDEKIHWRHEKRRAIRRRLLPFIYGKSSGKSHHGSHHRSHHRRK